MKVKNKTTGTVVEATKIDENTYEVEGTKIPKADMAKSYEVVKAPIAKQSTKSNTEALEPTIGGDLSSICGLFEALSKCQSSMAVGKKNVDGFNYQYMDMSQVIDISKKPLADNGLAMVQIPSTYIVDDVVMVRITTMITHKDGGYISSHFDSPIKESKKQALIQTIGTNCSYMARYARNNILGISADKDTDGL